ncbi:hypothetical protein QAD02_007364 [Eretmocerus hayati]|uniref:Uncharacterized protein n=1 Tax=Eretmocerus hayati TaxID=131215 RepID=A0ACC2N3H2_9HYME|nr:hypothetical protein QAD02_007364 [Eretmocerus hayati]
MVIVPEEKFARMQNDSQPTVLPQDCAAEPGTDNSVQTVDDNLSRLDTEMYEILNSKKFTDEREKCKKYLQVLRRYLSFKENERDADPSVGAGNGESEILEDPQPSPMTEEAIIENLPLAHARNARSLLTHWQNSEPDRFKWNAKGNIIIDGRVIPHSDITKLLANVLSKGNKKGEIPIGQLGMARFIGISATPVNLVANLEILENSKRLTDPLRRPPKRLPPDGDPMTPLSSKLRVVAASKASVPSPPLTRNALKKKWLNMKM